MGERVRVGLSRPARTERPEPGRPSCASRTCVLELVRLHLLARAQPSRTCVPELVHPDRLTRIGWPAQVGGFGWVGLGCGCEVWAVSGARFLCTCGREGRCPWVFVAVPVILGPVSVCGWWRGGLYCTYVRKWCTSSPPGRWCGRGARRACRGPGAGFCGRVGGGGGSAGVLGRWW